MQLHAVKAILWCGMAAVLTIAAPSEPAQRQTKPKNDEAAFREQLRLARSEGIPTTVAEFVATLQKVDPKDNAAPIYMQIAKLQLERGIDLHELTRQVTFEPSENATAEANRVLKQNKRWLELAEQAASLPHCRFDRDWNLGPAMLFSELVQIRRTAQLLLLRGSLAAREGKHDEAVRNAKTALRIARHLDTEPLQLSRLVARAAYQFVVKSLECWSFRYRDHEDYFRALQTAVSGAPPLDLKAEHRYDLVSILRLIEICDTKEGRESLGLSEENIPKIGTALEALQPRSVGKVKIVKAVREYWALLDRPGKDFRRRFELATLHLYQGLLSFATAGKVYEALSGADEGLEPAFFQARALLHKVLLRALKPGDVPKSVLTSDCISPLDGKPVRYSFDGKQIVVDAGQAPESSQRIRLKVPPDPPKAE